MKHVVDALRSGAPQLEPEVGGRVVRLTSLDRVMWPQTGGTKRDLFLYYVAVAERLLPHIVARPLTLARYPEGVEGKNWFQTMCPHPPEWVTTHPIRARGGNAVTRNYCVVHDLAGLLWAVNLGTVELHPLLARSDSFEEPDLVAFDLDPGPPASLVQACAVALRVKEILDGVGLRSFVKTSGGVGMHVLVPLGAGHDYRRTKAFARDIAERLAADRADEVIALPDRSARSGKVFVDWSQNDANKSLIAPYSMRALPWPAASAPLLWDEVERVATTGSIQHLPLDAGRVLERSEVGNALDTLRSFEQWLP